MAKRLDIEVRRGRAYRVIARPVVKAAKPEPRPWLPEARAPEASPDALGRLVSRYYDGGALWLETPRYFAGANPGDLWNELRAIRAESPGPNVAPSFRAFLRDDAFARLATVDAPNAYLYSGRERYGELYRLGATDEVGGYNLVQRYRRRPERDGDPSPRERTYALAPHARGVYPMRPAAEQLAAWDAIEPPAGAPNRERARWERERARIRLLGYEKFSFYSEARAKADMTLAPPDLDAGQYCPAMASFQLYEKWDPLDPKFRSTRQAVPSGAEAIPWLPVGKGVTTEVDAVLEPRRVRHLFRWTALYINIVLFAPPILSSEETTGNYTDRTPLDYSFNSTPDSGLNDAAISAWMSGSKAIQLAMANDLGSQVFSPYFVKILVGRVDARWTLREADLEAGTLCATLDVRRNGAPRDRYHIFRIVTEPRFSELIDFGPLSNFAFGIYPHTRGESMFAGSPIWGPL